MAEKDVESIGLIIIGPRFPSFFLLLEKGIPIFEKKKEGGVEKNVKVEKNPKIGYFWARQFLKSSNCEWVGGNRTKIKFILSPFIFVNQFLKHPPVPNYFRHFPLPRWKSRKKSSKFSGFFVIFVCV